jgi:hypothetical protein
MSRKSIIVLIYHNRELSDVLQVQNVGQTLMKTTTRVLLANHDRKFQKHGSVYRSPGNEFTTPVPPGTNGHIV